LTHPPHADLVPTIYNPSRKKNHFITRLLNFRQRMPTNLGSRIDQHKWRRYDTGSRRNCNNSASATAIHNNSQINKL